MLAVVIALALMGLVVGRPGQDGTPAIAHSQTGPGGRPSSSELKRELLRQNVRKVQIDNRNSTGLRGFLSSYAAFLTALVAALGLVATLLKQTSEQSRQRRLDREQRQKDLAQRESESKRALDGRFSAILTDLGADSEPVQAGAAISLLTFLRPEHAAFRHEVRLVALANLKVRHSPAILKLLIRTFEAAMSTEEPFDPIELDLSGAELAGAKLSNLDLSGADLDHTNLRGADLSGSRLREARGTEVILEEAAIYGKNASLFNARLPDAHGFKVQFEGAELLNAHLEGADLRQAHFQGARMQAAHLEGADLRGAQFEGAKVADAYFFDAVFDDQALLSLAGADNLDREHLSPDNQTQLASLEAA